MNTTTTHDKYQAGTIGYELGKIIAIGNIYNILLGAFLRLFHLQQHHYSPF